MILYLNVTQGYKETSVVSQGSIAAVSSVAPDGRLSQNAVRFCFVIN